MSISKINILLLLLIISFSSCRRNKIQRTIAEIQKDAIEAKSDSLKSSESSEKIVLNIDESDFDVVKLKSKVDFKSPIFSQSFPANIHVKKDSAIWISVAVGIEIGRALITTDSVKVLDRINRKYYELGIAELSNQFDFELDFQLLQSLVLGDLPIDRKTTDSLAYNSLYTSLFQKKGRVFVENQVDNVNHKLLNILANDYENGNRLGISYSQFVNIENELIPSSIFTKIDNTKKIGDPSTMLEIFHNKIELGDINIRFPFNVPRSYEKGFIQFDKK